MNVKEMAAEMIDATKAFVARELKPLHERIIALELRAPVPGPKGDQGEKGEPGEAGVSIKGDPGERGEKGDPGEPGKDGRNGVDGIGKEGQPGKDGKDGANGVDGKSVDPAEVERLVIGYVQKAVSALPSPRDGKDGRDGESVSVLAVEALVRAEVAKAVSTIPAGKDGKDAAPVDVDAVIEQVVKRVPIPRDGKDAQPIDTDVVIAEVIKRIPIPKDGQDGKSITIEDVAPLLEAEVARWETHFERRADSKLQKIIDRIPIPRDGVDGKDGKDGFGFTDFDMDYDGERTFTFKWSNAERQAFKEVKAPIPLYREVWKSSERYERGDIVTYGGSQWTAVKDQLGTPGEPDSGWRLSVKRGQK